MKKLLLIAIALLTFCTPSFSAVTTTDGLITLDFHEDTTQGVDNLWVLDFSVNDIDGPGGIEDIRFWLIFYNQSMDLNNEYNISNTDYYSIGYYASNSMFLWPDIALDTSNLSTPVMTDYFFYSTPLDEGEPILGDFWIRMSYSDNLGNQYNEDVQLSGPVDFVAVPEPVSIALFSFGIFILKFFIKQP